MNNPPPVPKRPLTSFNLFSILERRYILQQSQKSDSTESSAQNNNTGDCDSNSDPYGAIRPPRYRDLVLAPDWYVVGANRKKRQDHQNHGLISFQDLSNTLSGRWQTADDEIKAYCKKIANGELDNYRKQQEEYKKKYGADVFAAQKKSHKRQKSNNDNNKASSKPGNLGVEGGSNVDGKPSQVQLQEQPLVHNQAMIQLDCKSSRISPTTDNNGSLPANPYSACYNSTRADFQEIPLVQDQAANPQNCTNSLIPLTELRRSNGRVHTNPFSENLLSMLDSNLAVLNSKKRIFEL